tara:strand:+ start:1512 stop:2021 length:510 start_codon:yes stop_codon:yes gene_type:complete
LKYFTLILCLFFISSCATTSVDHREIIPELFDSELKKGKIFVLSNHVDVRPINIRVNGDVQKIKHTQAEIFDLKDGQNSVFSFMSISGSEQLNCDDQPYTFNTEMFPEVETYYFVIQSVINKDTILKLRCFKDFQVNEDFFVKQLKNPRSGSNEFLQHMTEDFLREFVF